MADRIQLETIVDVVVTQGKNNIRDFSNEVAKTLNSLSKDMGIKPLDLKFPVKLDAKDFDARKAKVKGEITRFIQELNSETTKQAVKAGTLSKGDIDLARGLAVQFEKTLDTYSAGASKALNKTQTKLREELIKGNAEAWRQAADKDRVAVQNWTATQQNNLSALSKVQKEFASLGKNIPAPQITDFNALSAQLTSANKLIADLQKAQQKTRELREADLNEQNTYLRNMRIAREAEYRKVGGDLSRIKADTGFNFGVVKQSLQAERRNLLGRFSGELTREEIAGLSKTYKEFDLERKAVSKKESEITGNPLAKSVEDRRLDLDFYRQRAFFARQGLSDADLARPENKATRDLVTRYQSRALSAATALDKGVRGTAEEAAAKRDVEILNKQLTKLRGLNTAMKAEVQKGRELFEKGQRQTLLRSIGGDITKAPLGFDFQAFTKAQNAAIKRANAAYETADSEAGLRRYASVKSGLEAQLAQAKFRQKELGVPDLEPIRQDVAGLLRQARKAKTDKDIDDLKLGTALLTKQAQDFARAANTIKSDKLITEAVRIQQAIKQVIPEGRRASAVAQAGGREAFETARREALLRSVGGDLATAQKDFDFTAFYRLQRSAMRRAEEGYAKATTDNVREHYENIRSQLGTQLTQAKSRQRALGLEDIGTYRSDVTQLRETGRGVTRPEDLLRLKADVEVTRSQLRQHMSGLQSLGDMKGLRAASLVLADLKTVIPAANKALERAQSNKALQGVDRKVGEAEANAAAISTTRQFNTYKEQISAIAAEVRALSKTFQGTAQAFDPAQLLGRLTSARQAAQTLVSRTTADVDTKGRAKEAGEFFTRLAGTLSQGKTPYDLAQPAEAVRRSQVEAALRSAVAANKSYYRASIGTSGEAAAHAEMEKSIALLDRLRQGTVDLARERQKAADDVRKGKNRFESEQRQTLLRSIGGDITKAPLGFDFQAFTKAQKAAIKRANAAYETADSEAGLRRYASVKTGLEAQLAQAKFRQKELGVPDLEPIRQETARLLQAARKATTDKEVTNLKTGATLLNRQAQDLARAARSIGADKLVAEAVKVQQAITRVVPQAQKALTVSQAKGALPGTLSRVTSLESQATGVQSRDQLIKYREQIKLLSGDVTTLGKQLKGTRDAFDVTDVIARLIRARQQAQQAFKAAEHAGADLGLSRQYEMGYAAIARVRGYKGVGALAEAEQADAMSYMRQRARQLEQMRLTQQAIPNVRVVREGAPEPAPVGGTPRQLSAAELKRIDEEVTQVTRGMRELQQVVNGNVGTMHQLSLAARAFFRYAVLYGSGYRVLQFFGDMKTQVLGLDEALTNIKTVAQLTSEQLREVSSAIRGISDASKTSVRDVATAATVLAQAGVESERLPAALRSTVDYAETAGADLRVAADTITSLQNVFSENSFRQVADTLTSAVNISKLNPEDLRVITSLGAQQARATGFDLQQFLGSAATLRNAGISQSTIATGLRQALIELYSPDKQLLQKLKPLYKKLGEDLSAEEIRIRFQSFKNSPMKAIEELKYLGADAENAGVFDRQAFEVRALNVLRPLVANYGQLQANVIGVARPGVAAEGAKTQLEAVNNAFSRLKNTLVTLSYTMTSSLFPGLAKMGNYFADIGKRASDKIIENRAETGKTIVGEIVDSLTAAFVGAAAGRLGTAALAASGVVGTKGKIIGGLGGLAAGGLAGLGLASGTVSTAEVGVIAAVVGGIASLAKGLAPAAKLIAITPWGRAGLLITTVLGAFAAAYDAFASGDAESKANALREKLARQREKLQVSEEETTAAAQGSEGAQKLLGQIQENRAKQAQTGNAQDLRRLDIEMQAFGSALMKEAELVRGEYSRLSKRRERGDNLTPYEETRLREFERLQGTPVLRGAALTTPDQIEQAAKDLAEFAKKIAETPAEISKEIIKGTVDAIAKGDITAAIGNDADLARVRVQIAEAVSKGQTDELKQLAEMVRAGEPKSTGTERPTLLNMLGVGKPMVEFIPPDPEVVKRYTALTSELDQALPAAEENRLRIEKEKADAAERRRLSLQPGPPTPEEPGRPLPYIESAETLAVRDRLAQVERDLARKENTNLPDVPKLLEEANELKKKIIDAEIAFTKTQTFDTDENRSALERTAKIQDLENKKKDLDNQLAIKQDEINRQTELKRLEDRLRTLKEEEATLLAEANANRRVANTQNRQKTTVGAGGLPAKLRPWEGLINEMSQKYNVPANLLAGVMMQESTGNPKAVSPVGAAGLIQLMPGTAKRFGITPQERFDPRKNVEAGTKYLAYLLDYFKGDTRQAVAGYNAGEGAVKAFAQGITLRPAGGKVINPAGRKTADGLPPYTETQEYVKRVMGYAAQFAGQAPSTQPAIVRADQAARLKEIQETRFSIEKAIAGLKPGDTEAAVREVEARNEERIREQRAKRFADEAEIRRNALLALDNREQAVAALPMFGSSRFLPGQGITPEQQAAATRASAYLEGTGQAISQADQTAQLTKVIAELIQVLQANRLERERTLGVRAGIETQLATGFFDKERTQPLSAQDRNQLQLQLQELDRDIGSTDAQFLRFSKSLGEAEAALAQTAATWEDQAQRINGTNIASAIDQLGMSLRDFSRNINGIIANTVGGISQSIGDFVAGIGDYTQQVNGVVDGQTLRAAKQNYREALDMLASTKVFASRVQDRITDLRKKPLTLPDGSVAATPAEEAAAKSLRDQEIARLTKRKRQADENIIRQQVDTTAARTELSGASRSAGQGSPGLFSTLRDKVVQGARQMVSATLQTGLNEAFKSVFRFFPGGDKATRENVGLAETSPMYVKLVSDQAARLGVSPLPGTPGLGLSPFNERSPDFVGPPRPEMAADNAIQQAWDNIYNVVDQSTGGLLGKFREFGSSLVSMFSGNSGFLDMVWKGLSGLWDAVSNMLSSSSGGGSGGGGWLSTIGSIVGMFFKDGGYLGNLGKRATGGLVDARQGGQIKGPGTGTSDSIPAITEDGQALLVSNKEYILPERAVKAIGLPTLERMRRMSGGPVAAFAEGGLIGGRSMPLYGQNPPSAPIIKGGDVAVNVNDYRTKGEQVETNTRKDQNGNISIDVIIRDKVETMMNGGVFDRALNRATGGSRQGVKR